MNGIYLLPIGWQILKQISKCCARKNQDANRDGYQAFNEFVRDDEDTDISMTCLNMLALVLSIFLAGGGLAYALFLYFRKVMFIIAH